MQKSLAIKLGVITAIALLLLVPVFMVEDKIAERAMFERFAREEVARSWTGHQQLTTPVIVLPYRCRQALEKRAQQGFITDGTAAERTETQYRLVAPESVRVTGTLSTEVRRKGIYRIPVYTAALSIAGKLHGDELESQRQAIAGLPGFVEHGRPFVAVMLSDARGIGELPTLSWAGGKLEFAPGSGVPGAATGIHAELPVTTETGDLPFQLDLRLKGMETLSFVPAGLDTQFQLRSHWPHPRFEGAFLPVEQDVNDDGFLAKWRVNQFSSDIVNKLLACGVGDCTRITASAFGVSLIEPVDIYLQSERATKYAILFIGLSFIAFFIFEVMRELRIHPVQYTLVGLSIAIFYLLLISLSEHLQFVTAYALASMACVSLLLYYVKYLLGGWPGALLFASMLAVLYLVLYVIIQAEDFALLGGSVLVFAVLAITMIITRDIDWYAVGNSSMPSDAIAKPSDSG